MCSLKFAKNMQPERKFAQICSQNESLYKYAAGMKLCKNTQPESKFA